MSKNVLPVLSSRSFMSSGLTFRPLIHLNLLLHMVRKWFNIILLHVAVQFSQHHLLKRLSFFPFYITASFVIDYLAAGTQVYFWTLYSVLLIKVSVWELVSCCFYYCSIVIQSEVKEHDIATWFFFLKFAWQFGVFYGFT